MMKKLLCILLTLMFVLPALAEEDSPFAPYALTAPEGAALSAGEGAPVFVSGTTRAVVQYISRVPDEAPAEALVRMMGQFAPEAVIGEALATAEGFSGLTAIQADSFGEGIDTRIAMVLSDAGDLLILSAYDMAGDGESAARLLDALLAALTLDGESVLLSEAAIP